MKTRRQAKEEVRTTRSGKVFGVTANATALSVGRASNSSASRAVGSKGIKKTTGWKVQYSHRSRAPTPPPPPPYLTPPTKYPPPIAELPLEIKAEILRWTDAKTLLALASSCKDFYAAFELFKPKILRPIVKAILSRQFFADPDPIHYYLRKALTLLFVQKCTAISGSATNHSIFHSLIRKDCSSEWFDTLSNKDVLQLLHNHLAILKLSKRVDLFQPCADPVSLGIFQAGCRERGGEDNAPPAVVHGLYHWFIRNHLRRQSVWMRCVGLALSGDVHSPTLERVSVVPEFVVPNCFFCNNVFPILFMDPNEYDDLLVKRRCEVYNEMEGQGDSHLGTERCCCFVEKHSLKGATVTEKAASNHTITPSPLAGSISESTKGPGIPGKACDEAGNKEEGACPSESAHNNAAPCVCSHSVFDCAGPGGIVKFLEASVSERETVVQELQSDCKERTREVRQWWKKYVATMGPLEDGNKKYSKC